MNLTVSEIKKLLNKWHFYKAITLSSAEYLLKQKLEAIERAVNHLDDISKAIIEMRCFKRMEMDVVAKHVYMTRQGVYKRLNKSYSEMVYFIRNTTKSCENY